ncbi:MAG: ArsB/NhaD family transporter [Alphaproteobacteria bacterium]|nr:ArsB/NhaD family transporter [Alphaproteobacteria bacterium]
MFDLTILTDPKVVASMIMVACYVVLFSEKVNRAVVTLMAATFMILSGVMTQSQAIAGIDFNTISLLIGMMVIVSVTERSGLFQFVAVLSAQKVRANPIGILIMLGIITAVFSAFLDNVTTVLLIVPVSVQIARKLEIDPYPYLILEIFASNIGGTATLIGDPPNILIGSALNLSFTDFLVNLAPVVLTVVTILIAGFALIFRNALKTSAKNKAAVMRMNAYAHLTDKVLLYKSLIVLGCVIVGFIMAEKIHLENGVIALCGAAVLLLLYTLNDAPFKRDDKTEEMFNLVDWTTIFFFCGLFMVVFGLEQTGVLEMLGQKFISMTEGSIKRATFAILSISAIVSAAIDNIPFVATMIPILKSMESSLGGREAMMPVWWSLSLGSCFGGNGSLIGASANVIVAGLAAREGHPIRFLTFLLWSIPVMLLSVLVAGIYIYFKYW